MCIDKRWSYSYDLNRPNWLLSRVAGGQRPEMWHEPLEMSRLFARCADVARTLAITDYLWTTLRLDAQTMRVTLDAAVPYHEVAVSIVDAALRTTVNVVPTCGWLSTLTSPSYN